MSSDTDKPSEMIKAVAELAEAVPIYPDAIQPGAKEAGKALQTIGRAVNVALMPLKGIVWTFEQIEEFIQARMAEKMAQTPVEEIVTPAPNVAGPLLNALRFTGEAPELQELFANLLATSMDKRAREGTFPAFVHIIEQLCTDEAKILQIVKPGFPYPLVHLRSENEAGEGITVYRNLSLLGLQAECDVPWNVNIYIANFVRLGLATVWADGNKYVDGRLYFPLETHPEVVSLIAKCPKETIADRRVVAATVKCVRSGLELTPLGIAFLHACVWPYERRNAVSREA